jgi:TolB protein
MNADGSNPGNLGRGFRPKWSPDGRMIGFTLSGRPDNAFVMNADGSGRRRVTNRFVDTEFISWSPDGTKVAFGRHTPFARHAIIDGEPAFDGIGRVIWDIQHEHIYVVNLDGIGLVELTKDLRDFDCYGAAWSPDGTKIAITSTGGIYVLNSDGTNPVNITIHHDFRWGFAPRWSPDGTKILYEFEVQIGDEHHGEIYIMNADGSNPVNLTNHLAHDCCGVWWVNPSSTLVLPQEKLITTWGQIKQRKR